MRLNKPSRKTLIFLIIFICAVFMRLIAIVGTDNFHGIAAGKIIEARRLLEHPNKLTSWIVPAHGPVHLYLVALVLKLSNNSYQSACFLSFLFGVALLFPYFNLVRLLFDEESAILSILILAFFPLHVVYSALSTAETAFLFFLFSGLFFYVRQVRTNEGRDLVLSAILLGISTACRFEGGLFIMVAALLLIKRPQKTFKFLLTASIIPSLWMLGNFLISGNCLQFLFSSDTIVKTEFNFQKMLGHDFSFNDKITYWLMQIKGYFGWPIFILGLCGFLKYGFKKQYRNWGIIFVSILFYFTYKTIVEELAMQPRYGMSLGLLFVPFFSVFFLDTLKMIKKNMRKFVLAVFTICLMFRCAYLQLTMMPHAPYWVKQAAQFLKDNLKDGETVYVETEEDNLKAPLKIYSNLSDEQFTDHNPFSQDVELLRPEGRDKLKFIVLISQRHLKNHKEVFNINNCKIYQVRNQ